MSKRIDTFDPPEANPEVRDHPDRGSRPPRGPGSFVWASLRMGWRWLSRMKTALYLLATLGVLSIVATIVPQEPNIPTVVAAWRAGVEGPGEPWTSLIDGFGAYDVYGTPLFLALLLLLFTSLTACLVPRVKAFWRLARHGRPPLSRHLDSHPHQTSLHTSMTPAEATQAVRAALGRKRFRLRAPDPDHLQVAAEKGIISREGGSLLFHLSFYLLLIAIILGQLLAFRGQVGVVEGRAFADVSAVYWTQEPGRWWSPTDHRAFELQLDEFHIDWVREGQFIGTPTLFATDVTVTTSDGRVIGRTIEGNDPMVVDGMKIHQLGWGYAPRIVIEAPTGEDGELEVIFDDFLTATESDGAYNTAVKVARVEPNFGFQVGVIPTLYDQDGEASPGAPWADDPHVAGTVWRGDLQLDQAQNVDQIDTTGLDQQEVVCPDGRFDEALLALGQRCVTPDGVVISFPELRRFVGFQVSHRPTDPLLLASALLILLGLVPALYAYRRRVWVQADAHHDSNDQPSGTLVTVAGRAFQRPQAFEREFDTLVDDLARALSADPAPIPAPTSSQDAT